MARCCTAPSDPRLFHAGERRQLAQLLRKICGLFHRLGFTHKVVIDASGLPVEKAAEAVGVLCCRDQVQAVLRCRINLIVTARHGQLGHPVHLVRARRGDEVCVGGIHDGEVVRIDLGSIWAGVSALVW